MSWTWPPSLGDWTIDIIETGRFALDGGAMFGSVPRVLWEKLLPPDPVHRIPLALRLLLLRRRDDDTTVLVDTGIGDKYDERFADMFSISGKGSADESSLSVALSSVGVALSDVTHLVLTHLHFDHGGGVSVRDGDGFRPALPEAEHFLQKANLATAEAPNRRERASYLPENVEPLRQVPLTLLSGEEEVLPGLTLTPSVGHTDGMQTLRVEGGGRVLYYLADLTPTHHHLHLPFTMGYDLSPRDIMREKEAILSRAVEEEALVVFEHDPEVAAATVHVERGKYRVKDVVLASGA